MSLILNIKSHASDCVLPLALCDSSHLRSCYIINIFITYLLNVPNMPGTGLRAVDTVVTPHITFHKLPDLTERNRIPRPEGLRQ